MALIISGADIRATPPSRRMSAGTRSSAITAAAPASSAVLACSGVTTSMMTPPLSISARPALTRNVASSRMAKRTIQAGLLQPERLYPLRVLRCVAAVHAVRERLDHGQQRGVRAHVRGRVRGVVEPHLRELGDLAERRVGDGHGLGLPVACELHRAHDERVRAASAVSNSLWSSENSGAAAAPPVACGACMRRYSSRAAPCSSGKPSKPSACEKRTTVELDVFARRASSSAVWKAASSRWSTMYC